MHAQVRRSGGPFLSLVFATVAALTPQAKAQKPDLYDQGKFRTLELTFQDQNWFNTLIANKVSEKNIPADLKVDGTTYKNVGVRTRGVTSYSWGRTRGKLPLRITMDAFTSGGELYSYKTLVLNNGYADPSFCREILSYNVMRTRVPSPRANFVKVICNGVSYGVYVSVQAPNIDLIKEQFKKVDGNRYQGYRDFTLNQYTFAQLATFLPLKSSPNATSYHDLFAMLGVLHSAVGNRHTKLQDSLDVDQCLRQIAVDTIIGNHDGLYVHNYYMYNDPYHGRFNTMPWDLNQTFRITKPIPNRFHFAAKLVEPAPWLKRYHWHVRSLTYEWCDWKVIGPMATRLQAIIDAEMKNDKYGYGYAAFKLNLTTQSGGVPGLKALVDGLGANLRAYAPVSAVPPTLTAPTQSPAQPADRDTVWVTIQVGGTPTNVRVYHRVKGRFAETPMFDDGKHMDGAANDGRYGASLPIQLAGVPVEYYFSTENANAESLHPASGAHEPYTYRVRTKASSVVINELLARNENGIKDNNGQREDWIELLNPTAATIVIGGMYLTCDFSKPTLWQIPANIALAPGEKLIIWADDDTNQGPLHASFKLASTGEEVFLYDKDGKTLLDFATILEQPADISTGRLEDGAATWVTFSEPTPLGSNSLTFCGSRTWSALDRERHVLGVSMTGLPRIGTTPRIEFAGAEATKPYFVMIGLQPAHLPVRPLGFSLLLASPLLAEFYLPGSANGNVSVPMPVPNDPRLDGFKLSLQAFAVRNQLLLTSNGLEMRFCK